VYMTCRVVFTLPRHPRALHSFPTRRSSDLMLALVALGALLGWIAGTLVTRLARALRLDERSRTWGLTSALARAGIYRPLSQVLRSEEHTSELQSRFDLVCRLLLEKKKTYINILISVFTSKVVNNTIVTGQSYIMFLFSMHISIYSVYTHSLKIGVTSPHLSITLSH